MKKKTRKKVVRRKRRSRKSMTEKRVMKIKRGLMKSAKKLRLGAERTGAYVYGTLRRIVGNRSGPVTEGEVRLMFETHGIPLAEKGIFGSGYNALSQYGSVLKDSFKTADEAEEYTIKFYKMRPGLVRQDGSYRKAFRKARGLRRNGVMADAENEFLMKYGLTPDQARAKFFSMIGTSFEKAKKLSFEEKVKIRDEYEVFKKKLLKAKMSMRRSGLRGNPAKRDFYGDVYIGKKKVDTVFVRSISEGSKRERELDVMNELLSMPNSYELAWVRKPNGLYDVRKGFRIRET